MHKVISSRTKVQCKKACINFGLL